ncbi:MAG: hypothetical protein RMK75_03870 [Aquificaceae bacterium]|nr:hypothetical protein [Aquificaceae bacterium]MCS7277689.1 hypothetical protein [Aquificaceae bacterium]MDW8423444.1 hypothetical protein [Aquificaceae bacterium]
MFKDLFLKDWQYKLLALLLGTTLWFVLNLGQKVPTSVERPIELLNQEKGYEYKLDRKRARIRLLVMERFVSEETLDEIAVIVDVKGLREGEYTLKVEVKNIPRFLVSVEKLEPEYVRLKVSKAPQGGQ